MTPHASAFATPAHRRLILPKKKNGRPPRLHSVAVRLVRRARRPRARMEQHYSAGGPVCRIRLAARTTHPVKDAMTDVATSTCHAVTGGSSEPSWSGEERETGDAGSGHQRLASHRRRSQTRRSLRGQRRTRVSCNRTQKRCALRPRLAHAPSPLAPWLASPRQPTPVPGTTAAITATRHLKGSSTPSRTPVTHREGRRRMERAIARRVVSRWRRSFAWLARWLDSCVQTKG